MERQHQAYLDAHGGVEPDPEDQMPQEPVDGPFSLDPETGFDKPGEEPSSPVTPAYETPPFNPDGDGCPKCCSTVCHCEEQDAEMRRIMAEEGPVEEPWTKNEDRMPEIEQFCEVRNLGFGRFRESSFGETAQERGFWVIHPHCGIHAFDGTEWRPAREQG